MSEVRLTNEEIARVVMQYGFVECDVKGVLPAQVLGVVKKRDSIFPFVYHYKVVLKYGENIINYVIEDLKLLLTPLSAITDEQLNDIAKIYGGLWAKLDDNFLQIINKDNEVVRYFLLNQELPFMLSQYLIQQYYAVPLFFGINHWANGKTAIELGIATDKTQSL